jgi:nitrite reductase (cytochrome c-552)
MSAENVGSASERPTDDGGRRIGRRGLILAVVLTAALTATIAALLVSIFTRKQEARQPFVRVVEVNEVTTDPAPWGQNWPRQYDRYTRTVDVTQTRYGGSEAMPESKLEADPWLRRLYAGYAFSIDYRERRGHAYMLYDQEHTERVLQKPQAGACLHCHASIVPTWRRVGLEAMGQPADEAALAAGFRWDAVLKGFEAMSTMPYAAAHAELLKTPDGTPGDVTPRVPTGAAHPNVGRDTPTAQELAAHKGEAHPVSCVDCHDPATMAIRVTRPGFLFGIQAFAKSDAPAPHLPSVERWRQGRREEPYDPNRDATRQEMRSFVCGQCHVEYYCANKEPLFFPWGKGLRVEEIEAHYADHRFPDGAPFHDYVHGETGALAYKAQHPEFEMWSQGIHARSGVACADCHMPYVREGAMKISDHWVRSPLLMMNSSCQTCHNWPEAELTARVHAIQDRTRALIDRSARAMTDMLDAIRAAQAAGATDEQLQPIFTLQRGAMWRLDFISSENSMGFHASQEAARILAESIDLSRQAQFAAQGLRTPPAPTDDQPVVPVKGVTPTEKAPPAPSTRPAALPGPTPEPAPADAPEPEPAPAP